MFKKNYFVKFLALFFFLTTNINFAYAEVIDVQNEERNFGEWKAFCEVDAMMDMAHCKVASKFYENSAVITIQATSKFFNQFLMLIPQIKLGSFVKIRVDKNDLILSQNASQKDFGLVSLTEEQKNSLYNQMKSGDFLFLRFNVRDSEKEVTIKINLKDFRSALAYSNSRTK
jgi:invasion protein IalB